MTPRRLLVPAAFVLVFVVIPFIVLTTGSDAPVIALR